MSVHTRRQGQIGYVELDNPPVNAMGQSLRQALLDAVAWAECEALERVIVHGRGRVFAAGGDIREFDGPPLEPQLPEVLARIEGSEVPWIAAVHGAALGGGLELMLACRHRICAPGTRLGLPETTLGVIPGAGGTQRLPRLIGMEQALAMVPYGQPINADDAISVGLIDEIDIDPLHCAERCSADQLGTKVSELDVGISDGSLFDDARAAVALELPGQIAPQRAIDLLQLSQRLPFAEAMRRERETFIELRNTDQARALRELFFADRVARVEHVVVTDR